MSEVRFSAAAESDLLDIVDFIARDNPRAAREWLAAVRERCQLLADHPLTGELRPGFGVAGCRSVSTGMYMEEIRDGSDFRVTASSTRLGALPFRLHLVGPIMATSF